MKRDRLQFRTKPSTSASVMGRRQRWRERQNRYRVERFPEWSGEFIAIDATDGAGRVLGSRRSLRAAVRLCREHAGELSPRATKPRRRRAAAK